MNVLLKNLVTPKELIDKYPECGYNHREIGYLLMLGVIRGKKTRYTSVVCEESFRHALEHRKKHGQMPAELKCETKKINAV